MGFFGHSTPSERSSADNNGFERHEIKTYQRKGDQVRSEYERLNPDGTVTKSVAYGNVKEGLKYRSFQMFQDGTIREVAPEQNIPPPPRSVAPPPPPPQPQPAQQKVEPRKYSFIVEPKSSSTPGTSTWRIRPVNSEEKKAEIPSQPAPQPKKENPNPWWYESIKEAFVDSPNQEERPKPKAIEEPERKPSKRNIFDIFNDDFFFMKPKHVFKAPKITDPFDMIEDSFGKSLLGDISKCPFLSSF